MTWTNPVRFRDDVGSCQGKRLPGPRRTVARRGSWRGVHAPPTNTFPAIWVAALMWSNGLFRAPWRS